MQNFANFKDLFKVLMTNMDIYMMIFYQTFSLFCSAFAPATLVSLPLAAHVSVPDAAFTSPSSVGGTSDPGHAPAPLLHGEGGNLEVEIGN